MRENSKGLCYLLHFSFLIQTCYASSSFYDPGKSISRVECNVKDFSSLLLCFSKKEDAWVELNPLVVKPEERKREN